MTRGFEAFFAVLTLIQVAIHPLEWALLLFPRSHARRSSPRILPVLGYEALWYAIAILPGGRCPESDATRKAVLIFGAVHILGWLSLQTDTLRVRLQAAARSASTASSVTEIVLLLAHDTRKHWKARTKSHRSTYIATFLFDLVETVVLCQVLWCSASKFMLRR